MKTTVLKVLDKMGLIKFLRKKTDLSLSEAQRRIGVPTPFVLFEDFFLFADDEKALKKVADIKIEGKEEEVVINYNINHSPEYLAALEWHNSLPDEEKQHIEHIIQLVIARMRPAVC
jgi:hypothetical protein